LICVLILAFLAALFLPACNSGDDDDSSGSADDDDNDNDDSSPDDDDDDNDNDDSSPDDDDDDDDNDDDNDDDDNDDDDTSPDCDAVITRQPYLQTLTGSSVRILWRTDKLGDGVVEYGTTADLGQTAAHAGRDTHHFVQLDGLPGGTEIYYKVRSCADESTIASFRTDPGPDEPITFVGFSDNQTNIDIFTQIAALMAAQAPDLAISCGDTAGSGWDPDGFDTELFGPGAAVFRQAPLYVAIGNHEGESIFFYNSFSFPNGGSPYYSFKYGNTFFIALALDTARPYYPGTPQYEFFVDALASDEAQNAEFRVVFFHTPPWTEGWIGYEGEPAVRQFIVPLMEQYGVDVYFNGHTHDFERGLLNGVTSYIIGGAAGGLDSWARDVPHITVYNAIHHFVRVDVDGPTMTITAIDLDGNVIDVNAIAH
jgi:hypothetical protein